MTPFPRAAALVLALLVALPAAARAGDPVPAPTTPSPAPAPTPPPAPRLEALFLEFGGLDEPKGAVVEKALGEVKGVRSFAWVTRTTDAKVVREAGTAADAALLAAAKAAGATTAGVVPMAAVTLTFTEPLSCAGCIRVLTTALRVLPAVKEVEVPDARATVTIRYDARTGKVADFVKALADAEQPVLPPK